MEVNFLFFCELGLVRGNYCLAFLFDILALSAPNFKIHFSLPLKHKHFSKSLQFHSKVFLLFMLCLLPLGRA